MFLCEKKKITAMKLLKTNIGQGSQQSKRYWVCQNIQFIHVPKRRKNTSKLFSICKYILWIFPEDEFVSFKNRMPKYLIKRTRWNKAKEENSCPSAFKELYFQCNHTATQDNCLYCCKSWHIHTHRHMHKHTVLK